MKFNYQNKSFFENPTWIKTNCKVERTDLDQYVLEFDKISDTFLFRSNVAALGCSSIDTRPIELKKNDSIVMNFYFAEDDKPIIDCQ